MPRLSASYRHRLPLPGHAGLRALLMGGLTLLLYACQSPVTTLQSSTASGDEFTRALTQEYRAFSTFEAEEMVDWPDAEHFARKGLLAAQGFAVEPEHVKDWRIPKPQRQALDQARNRLAWVLAAGAGEESPVSAATAQSRFDCWIEQQEENWQPQDIAACRDGFYALLGELEELNGPRSARLTLVLFKFDSDKIDVQAASTLDAMARWAHAADAASISVTGHTDRAGSERYNINLSLRRALASRAALVRLGLRPETISYSGAGEMFPRVPTEDGVREALNRRVELEIQLPEIPTANTKSTRIVPESRMFAAR